jgi:hypothetical protein
VYRRDSSHGPHHDEGQNGWQRNDRGFSRGAMPEMSSHLFSPSASSFSFHEEISSPTFAGNFRQFAHNHNQIVAAGIK